MNSAANQNKVSPRLCVDIPSTRLLQRQTQAHQPFSAQTKGVIFVHWRTGNQPKQVKSGNNPMWRKVSSKSEQKSPPLFASLSKQDRMQLLQHHSFALWLLVPHILHLRVESCTISMRFNYAGM